MEESLREALVILSKNIPGMNYSTSRRLAFLLEDKPYPPIEYRNCLYHITPIGNYEWNLEQLKKYAHIFNHQKIAAVATGKEMDDPRQVEKMLPGFEIIKVPNDPHLREVASFVPLLERLKEIRGATWYGHTKGVTKPKDVAIKEWTEAMYFHTLGRWEECMQQLTEFCCTGAFRRFGQYISFPKESKWHYSGTFFWFRNDAFFTKPWKPGEHDWRKIHRTKYGVEAHLSLLFDERQSGVIFGDRVGSLYQLNYVRKLLNGTGKPNGELRNTGGQRVDAGSTNTRVPRTNGRRPGRSNSLQERRRVAMEARGKKQRNSGGIDSGV